MVGCVEHYVLEDHCPSLQLADLGWSPLTSGSLAACLQGSMYVRLKRKKQTFFLHVDPTDTVAQMKAKLADVVQQVGWLGGSWFVV
jgi:hypothetical protein